MGEVPFEALVEGVADIIKELLNRGYKQDIILQVIRDHIARADTIRMGV